VIVPEKSPGNKKCDEEQEEEEEEVRHIFGLFGIAVKWPRHGCMTLLISTYVHTVEDSTLMPIFDQFRFSFVFLGLPKIGPTRWSHSCRDMAILWFSKWRPTAVSNNVNESRRNVSNYYSYKCKKNLTI